jgi:thiol-disulfide isomerase/thioredoxin
MKKAVIKTSLFICFLTISILAKAQTSDETKRLEKIKHLVAVINAHPDSIAAHRVYIYLAGWDNMLLQQNYKTWLQRSRFSTNALLQLGWNAGERPEAKQFFLKALETDSTRAEIWNALAGANFIAGDNLKYSEYKKRASELAPDNADYAASYMYSLEKIDPAKYKSLLVTFEDRFPNTVRGAQSLYRLALEETDTATRIKAFEKLSTVYYLHKDWIIGSVKDLYDLYLQTDPQKAVELANTYHWPPKAVQAQKILMIKQFSAERKYGQALVVIDSLEQMKNLYQADLLVYKKAELYDLMGASGRAYDTLMKKMIKTPTAKLHNLLVKYGDKIGKQESDVSADWWKMLEQNANMAPVFSSKLFTADKRVSLSDYRGKVVLLTFWFPGCGPCRAEFPHFENVLKKFDRGQVAYLGVNAMEEQDGNVLNVVDKEMLTFTPLHGTRKAEKLFNFTVFPTNFLIDKQGRIIFRDFEIGDDNEDLLELMINQLLNADKIVQPRLIADTMKKN